MSHFLVQFSSDVAVFGRRCQFEILLPESFQKNWHFVDQHLVDLSMRAMLFLPLTRGNQIAYLISNTDSL